MNKQIISRVSAINAMVLMILCSSTLMAINTIKQDFWLSILLSALLFFPIVMVYSRICALYPQQGLYEIIPSLFGRAFSFLLTLLFSTYAVAVAALTLRNYVEFTVVISLGSTPRIPLMMVILFVVAFLAYQGLAVFGKWSNIICVIILVNLILTILMSLDAIDLSHIKPIFDHSIYEIAENSTSIGSISIGDCVLILALMGQVGTGKKSGYQVFLWGLLIGIVTLALIALRNLLVLGPEMLAAAMFSEYMAVRIIHLGSFFERMESIISFSLILIAISKIAVCLIAASMGTAKLLRTDNYLKLLLPVSLLVLALCSVIFKTPYEMFNFAWVYKFVAFPMQVAIPVIMWIVAEIKLRKKRTVLTKKENPSS